MATTDYVVGGIFAALSSSGNGSEDKSNLASLFSTPSTTESSQQAIVFNKKSSNPPKPKTDTVTKKQDSDDEEDSDDDLIAEVVPSKKKKTAIKPESNNKEELAKNKKVQEKEELEKTERTVFVGNLSVTATRKELKKLFKQHGEVETVRIRSVPTKDPKQPKKVALIKKEFHAERETMNAYVVFKSKESAGKAMQSNGTEFGGFHIRVDMAANSTQHDHKNSLFIGNLSFACKEEELRAHFSECGNVANVRLVRDKASGLGKGFGYVTFQDHGSVMLGLKMNGSQLNDRPLRVQKSTSTGTSKRGGPNNPGTGGARRQQFSGVRATSKKDLAKIKKEFKGDGPIKAKSIVMNPALQRMKNKAKKGIQQKKAKRKGSIEKKLNKNKKTKN